MIAEPHEPQKRWEVGTSAERVVWNPALSLPAREFEFSDPEVSRIKAAIETWDSYGAAADRRWLEPLVNVTLAAQAGGDGKVKTPIQLILYGETDQGQ